MVKRYVKHQKAQLSEHLSSLEFDCHCTRPTCTTTLIETTLVDALEKLWEIIGPYAISSGFRCNAHNAEVGGTPGSYHLRGKAADVQSMAAPPLPGFAIARLAEQIPAFANGGIGVYLRFCHVDTRLTPARWGLTKLC